jgi:hypothetical protein
VARKSGAVDMADITDEICRNQENGHRRFFSHVRDQLRGRCGRPVVWTDGMVPIFSRGELELCDGFEMAFLCNYFKCDTRHTQVLV